MTTVELGAGSSYADLVAELGSQEAESGPSLRLELTDLDLAGETIDLRELIPSQFTQLVVRIVECRLLAIGGELYDTESIRFEATNCRVDRAQFVHATEANVDVSGCTIRLLDVSYSKKSRIDIRNCEVSHLASKSNRIDSVTFHNDTRRDGVLLDFYGPTTIETAEFTNVRVSGVRTGLCSFERLKTTNCEFDFELALTERDEAKGFAGSWNVADSLFRRSVRIDEQSVRQWEAESCEFRSALSVKATTDVRVANCLLSGPLAVDATSCSIDLEGTSVFAPSTLRLRDSTVSLTKARMASPTAIQGVGKHASSVTSFVDASLDARLRVGGAVLVSAMDLPSVSGLHHLELSDVAQLEGAASPPSAGRIHRHAIDLTQSDDALNSYRSMRTAARRTGNTRLEDRLILGEYMSRRSSGDGVEKVALWAYAEFGGYGIRPSRPARALVVLIILLSLALSSWSCGGDLDASIVLNATRAVLPGLAPTGATPNLWRQAATLLATVAGPVLIGFFVLGSRWYVRR